jgi:DNA-binding winged helix-turn-helix (wHTH) protein
MTRPSSRRLVRFGDFEVDLPAHELRQAGRRIALQEKPFQLLALLLEQPGEAVTRESLRQQLWPPDTYVEFDDSLNHAVRRLREALGDTSSEPQYIETIPRFGYRFVAGVDPGLPTSEDVESAGPEPRAVEPHEVPSARTHAAIAGAVVILILIWVVADIRSGSRRGPSSPVPIRSAATEATGRARPVRPEADVAYQRGRRFMEQPAPNAQENAIVQFRRAIALEPGHAPAHAWMARGYVRLAHNNQLSPRYAFSEVERAAGRALALDPSLPEAIVAMAAKTFMYDWNWAEAERLYARGLSLAGSDAESHASYADYLSSQGRFDEALRETLRAIEIDPVSLSPGAVLALYYYLARRHDLAIEQSRSVLAVDPDHVIGNLAYGFAALARSDATGGRAAVERYFRLSQSRAYAGVAGYARAVDGDRDGALAALGELEALGRDAYASPVQFALVHAGLGNRDAAFAWLERAYEARDHDLAFLKVWPMYDSLRSDPRFAALLRRLGL